MSSPTSSRSHAWAARIETIRQPGRTRTLVNCQCGTLKWVYWWSASGYGAFKMPCGAWFKWPSLEATKR